MDALDNPVTPPGHLRPDGERFLPGQMTGAIEVEHVHRYRFAAQFVAGKVVLDIACGEGYGTALLAAHAQQAVGVDIAEEAVAHARAKYRAENLEYRAGSCAQIPLADAAVDVVVSFETIEHHDMHEAMLREIRRVLRPGGLLVISSPDKLEYSDKPGYRNPFHVHELYRQEFEALLAAHFAHRQLLGQRVLAGSALLADAPSQALLFDRIDAAAPASAALSAPVYWVAVASDAPLPPVSGGLLEQTVQDPRIEAMRERNRAVAELVLALAVPGSPVLRGQLQGPYLQKNPDVAAAGIDPEAHWNLVGRIEGRELTSDPAGLVQALGEERQQALRQEIDALQGSLREVQGRAEERQRSLAAELAQARIAGAQALETQLRAGIERERSFGDELAQVQRQAAEAQRAIGEKLQAATDGFAQRERQLLEELAARERELHETQRAAQLRMQKLEAELAQETARARSEIAAHLRLQVERERQAATDLLRTRAEAEADASRQVETLKRELATQARGAALREERLRGDLRAAGTALRRVEQQAARKLVDLEIERTAVWAEAHAKVAEQLKLRLEREQALQAEVAALQREAEARWRAGQRAAEEQLERLAARHSQREERLQSEAAAAAREQAQREQQLRNELEHLRGHLAAIPPTIEQLLACDGEHFLHNAYLSLLGRPADPEGFAYYMERYHAGVGKMQIVAQICRSPEAAQKRLALPGLGAALQRHSVLSLPLVGPLLGRLGLRHPQDHVRRVAGAVSALPAAPPAPAPGAAQGGIYPEVTREEFDPQWYLSNYPDVAKAGIDPYEHYMTAGRLERRRPNSSGFPQLAPLPDEELERLRAEQDQWPRKPLISILMPVYDTPEPWLRAALDSVLNQLYEQWELCVANDASPQAHVKQVLDEYQQRDARIKVVHRSSNGRVSAASNSALALATGEFTVLFDHDDLLEPHALHHMADAVLMEFPDMVYSDELIVDATADKVIEHAFRPAFSLELLRSHPYIVHLVGFRTELLQELGGFDESLTISQDYDLILRCVERSHHIVHVPKALYRWRTHEASEGHAARERVLATSRRVLANHLQRCGEQGTVREGAHFNFFETRYALAQGLRVAIIVPTKNHGELVRQCIRSIEATVAGIDYEIVLIDHDSNDPASLSYFRELANDHTVLQYHGEFNFSAINNWAVRQLDGAYSHYLFCNNDIEAIHEGWLQRMLELAQKPDIGIVGAKLYYPDRKSIQHAGVCVGMYGAAEHYGKFMDKDLPDGTGIHPGYIGSLITNHEMSAVTAACMLMRSDAFATVRGFDELAKVGFGDVDLCLRVREAGYRVVFCPHAELIHHESVSRGKSTTDPHPEDSAYYRQRWLPFMRDGDPYYNPNLTLMNTHWQLKGKDDLLPDLARMKKHRSFRRVPGPAGPADSGQVKRRS